MEENVDALMDTFLNQIRKMLATGTGGAPNKSAPNKNF